MPPIYPTALRHCLDNGSEKAGLPLIVAWNVSRRGSVYASSFVLKTPQDTQCRRRRSGTGLARLQTASPGLFDLDLEDIASAGKLVGLISV